jgi:nitrogen fixation protein FixH
MRSGKWWPLALAAVLGVTVAANVFLLYAANDRNAAAVEPDYYRKAVAWDSTAAQAAQSAGLGWRIDAAILPLDPRGAGVVQVRIARPDGAPLAGARVTCSAIHNLDAAHRPQAETVLDGIGEGTLVLPLRRAGLWELRFAVKHGAERFTASLRRDAGFAPLPRGG